jgi:hypothetical protein
MIEAINDPPSRQQEKLRTQIQIRFNGLRARLIAQTVFRTPLL